MAISERVKKALSVTSALGIPDNEVKPVLKQLYEVFERNWEHIEANNYQALLDRYFEYKENQHNVSERPSKRPNLGEREDQVSSTMDNSSQLRVLEKKELSMSTCGKGAVESSEPRLRDRTIKSRSLLPCSQISDNVKNPGPSSVPSGDINPTSGKASSSVHMKQPEVEPGSSRGLRKNVASYCNMELIRPKSGQSIIDMAHFAEPVSVNHPEVSSTWNSSAKPVASSCVHIDNKDDVSRCSDSTKMGSNIVVASSLMGEVELYLNCASAFQKPNFQAPKFDKVVRDVEDKLLRSSKLLDPQFSVKKLLIDLCNSFLELGTAFSHRPVTKISSREVIANHGISLDARGPNRKALGKSKKDFSKKGADSSRFSNSLNPVNVQQPPIIHDEKRPFQNMRDITKGSEKVKISLVDEIGGEDLPKFTYMPQNLIYQNAYVHISLARIADEDCCSSCSGDCLSVSIPCTCARETGGEFAYTPQGLLKEEFLKACVSMKLQPNEGHFVYCQDCPLERSKNKCNGHLVRKFIKECWIKCGCNMQCGNRVVQRGVTCKLQVFLTNDGKGWGLRTLQNLPKGAFICEYVGEILTNTELYQRNMQNTGNERHTYPVTLDADWGSERTLRDEDALCLDATFCGNVARFINHRCFDANLIDIPVEVETPDRHYYHLAFFTSRDVSALEELSWDYGIDFSDHNHPVKAFQCCCGSKSCRDLKQKRICYGN
ncbi:SET domain-containing protein/Pre-SET domain-containing protein/WIYLD domain-containing protein [Cephalotus follicularis]|uniref:SET domain-containing protein/Pre-SET domain-containing protein/WIYLD domain-containing protein n=1 Tax=Cephalotus follicularis TaxID=3775 RepID=A0A1Q3CS91_CEPFO|nr:SET domain-containing protein/Pre-SET domain-containing protein/WIYLD domain-containing protein [Cephalotus follicularis]